MCESRTRPALALAVIGLGAAIVPLDTAVNVAFPAIGVALDLAVSDVRWIIICYVVTYASLLLAFGRIADLFGHRRVFIAGLVWSTVAFALCARADSIAQLLAARVLQGVGAALVLAAAPALATLSVAQHRRRQGVGAYMLAFSLATAVGPLIGGGLVAHWGWPAVYGFRIPLALLAALLALVLVPATPRDAATPRFDVIGAVVLALGLALALFAISLLGLPGSPRGWLFVAILVAALTLIWFVRRQRHVALRMLDMAVFRRRSFATLNGCHVVVNAASFMVMLLVPFFLVHALGVGTALGGALFAISPLGFVLASPLATRLLAVRSAHALGGYGLALNAAGLATIALWPVDAPLLLVGLALFAHGFGYGLFQVATLDHVMGVIPRAHHGVAGSLHMVTRTVGVVLGVSAGSALFDHLGGSAAAPGSDGFLRAFGWVFTAAAMVVVAAMAVLRLSVPRPGNGSGARP